MATPPAGAQTSPPLLDVRNLVTRFYTDAGVVHAVDGVDFMVQRGEVFGLVGESGCGKSVTGLSIMRLIDAPGKIVEGEVYFGAQSLLSLSEKEMEDLRGSRLSMIFQQPLSCLNPVFTVGSQVAEVLEIHRQMKKEEAAEMAVGLLHQVGIPDPESKTNAYPHEMSGGQAQRVMIAMALALNPELLIADEPTTALDVTVQAQILDLMREMIRTRDTGVILITHDLGVVADGRPGGGDVRRTNRRAERRHHAVRPAAPSVHAGPGSLRPRPGAGERAPGDDRRRGSRLDRSAGGVPLRSPLHGA